MAELITAESASSLFTYFNPTRSPYYTVGLSCCVALYFACDVSARNLWLWLAIPAYLVAAFALYLSIESRNHLSEAEHAEQLRFARSTSISVAVLALVFAGKEMADPGDPGEMRNFWINVTICCVQIGLFLLYSWLLNKTDFPKSERNYVQITLLTSAFLGDTSWNLSKADGAHHQSTAFALGLLWAMCVLFWVVQLVKLKFIQIQFRRDEDSATRIVFSAAGSQSRLRV